LGTKWIFLFDGNTSGRKLEKALKERYENYLDKDVFVFKYFGKDLGVADLMSKELLAEVYSNILRETVSISHLRHRLWDKSYSEFSKEIKKAFGRRGDKMQEKFVSEFGNLVGQKMAEKNFNMRDAFPEYSEFVSRITSKLKIKSRSSVFD